MKTIESITKTSSLSDEIAAAEGELTLVGVVPLNVIKTLVGFDYKTLDLSRAVFGQEEEEYQVVLGYRCNFVPVYGACGVRTVDVLKRLLEGLTASEVILPDDVARRHLNAIQKNSKILAARVTGTCALFSMVGKDVYNKKGTKLVLEN